MAKALKVYWAPDYGVDRIDWNMLYADPISVFDKSYKQKTNVDKYDSVLCFYFDFCIPDDFHGPYRRRIQFGLIRYNFHVIRGDMSGYRGI